MILKRFFSFLTVVAIISTFMVEYEKNGSNLSVESSSSKIRQGETVTVTISNSDMTISSMGAGIAFDKSRLQCVSVTQKNSSIDVVSTPAEANKSGTVGFAIIGSSDKKYKSGVMVTAKFTAIASGSAQITLYEDSDGKNGYKSDNASSKTISISGSNSSGTGYSDVSSGTWYSDAVVYVTRKGYMSGVGSNRFAPNYIVTRATIAQILYAREGKPSVKGNGGFSDISSGKWYAGAVAWAASKKIVSGYSNGKFGPDDPVTRQQMAAILYQYAKYKKLSTTASGNLSKYKDSGEVASYAVTPMKWAVGKGIISGTNRGLEPKGTATRAQIAVILQAFDKKLV